LKSEMVKDMLGEDRKVAIGFNGIAWFLPPEKLEHSLKILYEWADPGTKLFISDGDNPDTSGDAAKLKEFYKQVGQEPYFKPLEKFYDIVKPWNIEDPGFKLLEEWVDMPPSISKEIEESWEGGGAIYGGILRKD
ncbi:MAG TPA: hypothetical protein VKA68_06300, partial [bacterium]|nr:hypothetical protein [bacterium]